MTEVLMPTPKPWTRLATPPHREGCQCPPHELSRCYPCRATGEILTGDQWVAMEVYRDVNWRGYRLVEEVKRELEYHAKLAQHPERRGESYREPTDDQLGENAIHSWFEYSPADLVKAIRHSESEAHAGYDCAPAYDDPDCVAGKCRHTECYNQRFYAELEDQEQPTVADIGCGDPTHMVPR